VADRPVPTPVASAALGLAGVAATWGAIGLIVREVDLPAVAIVAARCWLGAAGIGVGLLIRWIRTGEGRPKVTRPWLLFAAGVVQAAHWLLLVAAQQRAPIGTVLLVMYLSPVLVAVLATRFLDERVTATTKLALALAVGGLALLVRPEHGAIGGVLLAAAAGVTFAVLTVISKVAVTDVGGTWLAFSNLTVAGLAVAPFALMAGWGPPQASWAWLLALGLGMTALLVPVYLGLLDRLPATTASVLLYFEPLSALVLGWLVLGEHASPATLAGGGLIVGAGILVLRQGGTTAEAEVLVHVPG